MWQNDLLVPEIINLHAIAFDQGESCLDVLPLYVTVYLLVYAYFTFFFSNSHLQKCKNNLMIHTLFTVVKISIEWLNHVDVQRLHFLL